MNLSSASFDGVGSTVAGINLIQRFPRLFKKTNTGAIQYWDIYVQPDDVEDAIHDPKTAAGEIVTVYGQLGTPSPQVTKDLVKQGKNPGKKNETTPLEQAIKEAQSKWDKQKKNKGYVETEEAARLEQVDESVIAGGLFPMLAQKYKDHPEKVVWPCYVQPKLNGIRCIAIVQNGKATLWTRKRKQITSLPHIVAALEESFVDIVLDGELFNAQANESSPDYKGKKTENPLTFKELGGLVRSKEPKGRYEMVQYHVYDIVNDKKFSDRNDELCAALSTVDFNIICPVQTGMVAEDSVVQQMMSDIRSLGYEGLMLRNAEGLYQQDVRSYDLLKVKKFLDDEFEIVDIEEGSGKLQGHVGSFVCRAKNGNLFKAKLKGELSFLKECFEDHSLWKGKQMTVEYAELTPDEQVPFHGVAIAIRDYE